MNPQNSIKLASLPRKTQAQEMISSDSLLLTKISQASPNQLIHSNVSSHNPEIEFLGKSHQNEKDGMKLNNKILIELRFPVQVREFTGHSEPTKLACLPLKNPGSRDDQLQLLPTNPKKNHELPRTQSEIPTQTLIPCKRFPSSISCDDAS